jgi:hypothetical protein
MLVSYTSGLLFMTEDPLFFNYIGWGCTALITTLITSISIKHVRQFAKIVKILCVGKQITSEKPSYREPVVQEILSAFILE